MHGEGEWGVKGHGAGEHSVAVIYRCAPDISRGGQSPPFSSLARPRRRELARRDPPETPIIQQNNPLFSCKLFIFQSLIPFRPPITRALRHHGGDSPGIPHSLTPSPHSDASRATSSHAFIITIYSNVFLAYSRPLRIRTASSPSALATAARAVATRLYARSPRANPRAPAGPSIRTRKYVHCRRSGSLQPCASGAVPIQVRPRHAIPVVGCASARADGDRSDP